MTNKSTGELAIIAKTVNRMIHKNRSEIMLLGEAGGFISTVGLAADAANKSTLAIIEEEETRLKNSKDPEPLNWKDKARIYIPRFAPVVISAGLTIGIMILREKAHKADLAAIEGLYTIAKVGFEEYRAKVAQNFGKRKEEIVREDISRDHLDKAPLATNPPVNVLVVGKGDMLCFDEWSGRYFYSNPDKILKAVNWFNHEMMLDFQKSVNDFYEELRIPTIPMGYDIGWSGDGPMLDIRTSSFVVNENNSNGVLENVGVACLVITFTTEPRPL